MKKFIVICLVLFIVGMTFTGCTLKRKNADDAPKQSGAPAIGYEVPDKAQDYNFDFEFVPEGE